MSRNLGYTKKFIILKKDFSNMNLQNPKGHGKIEIKGIRGNILISLENAEEEAYYNVILIGKTNSYNLGKVYTEISGRGREDIAFNIQDLASSGFQIDKLNGILIARDDKILLGGYMDKEDGSIERYIKNIKHPVQEEVAIEEVIQEEVIPVEEVIQEEVIPVEEVIQEEVIQEEVVEEEVVEEALQDEIIEETNFAEVKTEEIEEQSILQEENLTQEELIQEELIQEEPIIDIIPLDDKRLELDEPIEEQIILEEPVEDTIVEEVYLPKEDDFNPEFEPVAELNEVIEPESNEAVVNIRDSDYEDNRRLIQKSQTTNYILNILRYFPYNDPFQINLKGYNWWKIDYEEDAKGFLPYFSYIVGGYQKSKVKGDFISAKRLMSVYGHYIFGLYNENDDVKYYVYGVPGGFFRDEHPHGGVTGFNTWYSSNDYGGYWLLYIDPLTGHIIYPINPMIPTN